MKALELALLASGFSLIAWFLTRSFAPYMKRRLEDTAQRRAEDLREEFFLFPAGRLLAGMLAAGSLCAAVAFTLTGSTAPAAVAGISPVVFSGFAVRSYRVRRRRKVISELPGFLDVLAGQIKAGHSMQEALSQTIPLLPRDIRLEISWVFRLCRLGTPLSEAFLQWEKRMPCEEISLVVRPLRVALPSGGNLVELLCRSRDILRARHRMREKLRSLTAQGRLQAVVLTLLPPAFTVVLSKIDPGFLPRCFGTPQGIAILSVAAVLQIFGWLTIRKILSVKP
ncbi:MAG: type II secretion system F family protein [Deltaproteobacteria bacterium]|nr:type II secretion system F family protein [Deltaproteobacteria bacterium]